MKGKDKTLEAEMYVNENSGRILFQVWSQLCLEVCS